MFAIFSLMDVLYERHVVLCTAAAEVVELKRAVTVLGLLTVVVVASFEARAMLWFCMDLVPPV